jgi:hypothetical protein
MKTKHEKREGFIVFFLPIVKDQSNQQITIEKGELVSMLTVLLLLLLVG